MSVPCQLSPFVSMSLVSSMTHHLLAREARRQVKLIQKEKEMKMKQQIQGCPFRIEGDEGGMASNSRKKCEVVD